MKQINKVQRTRQGPADAYVSSILAKFGQIMTLTFDLLPQSPISSSLSQVHQSCKSDEIPPRSA